MTLIGDEAEPPYSRMAIPYLLMGRIGEAGTYLRTDAGHFEGLRIRLRQGRVTALDTGARRPRLADDSVLAYDRLLIATGAHPVRPPIPGIDSPKVLTCWTLADAMIRRWCEDKGVGVRTGRRVVAIALAGEALRVTLDDGEAIEVDVLISATGVKPNIAFLAGGGVAVDVGILVDEAMQTKIAGVHAAGDVAEAVELGTGRRVVNAIQPDAVEQARIAALNMAGQAATLRGTFVFNVLDTLGLISASFGQWQGVPGGETASLVDQADYRYLRLVFDGDRLVGANSIGHTEHIGVLRGLIQGRVRLGPWKERLLANPLQLSEAYLARGLAALH